MKNAILAALVAALAGSTAAEAWGRPGERGRWKDRDSASEARAGDEEADEPDEADEEKALALIRENDPEMHERLSKAREEAPKEFRRRMRGMGRMMRSPEFREAFLKNLKLEVRVRRLAMRARKADDKEKESLKKDLEKALFEQFDAKLAAHETRLKKMQEKISEMKEKIDKRRSLKDKIVKKRLGEILGKDDESWDW